MVRLNLPLIAFALTAAILLAPLPAVSQQDGIAFARAQNLRHGINASLWFAQTGDYSPHRLEIFTTDSDIALIKKMGFDHVRLSIDAGSLQKWQEAHTQTPFMAELDRVVKTILDDQLAVIIEVYPESDYKARLRQGSDAVRQFTELWRELAGHFASTDPEHVFFEIMNEPEQNDPYRWQGIESVVVDAIRRAAPNHTIIAAGANW